MKSPFNSIATSARFIMILLMMLLVVHMLQILVFAAYQLTHPFATKSSESINWILDTEKRFQADGTIHQIHAPNRHYRDLRETDEIINESIYDVNNQLIWEGIASKRPHTYLSWASSSGPRCNRAHMLFRNYMQIDFSSALDIPVRQEEETIEI